MSLPALPPELQLEIITHLLAIDKFYLSNVSRRFRSLIGPPNPREIFYHLLEIERLDLIRLRRTCARCIRLLPFYHFSYRHAAYGIRSHKRICLQCLPRSKQRKDAHTWLFGTQVGMCSFCGELVVCGRRYAHGCVCNNLFHSHLCKCLHLDPAHRHEVVSTLIERLDNNMTREELMRLKLDGYATTTTAGRDAVWEYVSHVEGMLLRREMSLGAEKHRRFWESQKWRGYANAGFEYFPSVEDVQTCEMLPRLELECDDDDAPPPLPQTESLGTTSERSRWSLQSWVRCFCPGG
ncbi:hypothetical protein K440DRAFT_615345 [Wilcoxina mikolae CBS 423.85]|nr:hypothetical protein K440DRAFT_615345 [Wilcoxina mikolae CBS 423.85]